MKDEMEDIAESLMFGIIKDSKQLNKRIEGKWQFRKNKGIEDVKEAVKKGLKLGAGKTEWEISGVALYLQDVFKKIN